MPLSVEALFNKVDLEPEKALRWDEIIPANFNGVYVISLSDDPSKNNNVSQLCEISDEVFNNWKSFSPDLNINGEISKTLIENELNRFWKPRENILYIGESSSPTNGLKKRLQQFYSHQVGWKGPHTGGYWIKLLAQLEKLYVYYAQCSQPRDVEFKMLMYFIEQSTGKNFYEVNGLGENLPFANLKADFQKKHDINKAVKGKKKEVNSF